MVEPKQGVGRPRNSQVDHAIVRATRELLVERGYAGLTVGAVAERAGVGKAAIYRRYATKQEMIFSAVVHDMREQAPPDTGSLRGDLAALCGTIAAQLGSAPMDVLAGLLADIYGDSALAVRFSETFLTRERLLVTEVLQRAVARGELTGLPDPATVQALLVGPVFVWLLMLMGDRDKAPEFARTVAETVASALLSGTV
ncbi:TetR/AcrR family transcriptional regulator [Streptomyces sp. NPDC045431]|uniref:TetR/AcrR family transcriptional regulator n=1 Tax=Streptomyces sp. NPDC045431 TaxID=3155613 RepID=UPI0033C3EE54